MTPWIQKAREFASRSHGSQRYGEQAYTVHLAAVSRVLVHFGFEGVLPSVGICPRSERLHMGAWLHDVLEDTPATWDDLHREFGAEVASLVAAVTDEAGPTRRVRKTLTYPKIRQHGADAVVLKLADRIANVSSSQINAPRLFVRYQAEHPEFYTALYRAGECDPFWATLNRIVDVPLSPSTPPKPPSPADSVRRGQEQGHHEALL